MFSEAQIDGPSVNALIARELNAHLAMHLPIFSLRVGVFSKGVFLVVHSLFNAYIFFCVRMYIAIAAECSYMIESPRWLATTGRLAECAKYLTVIARINGRNDAEITETNLKKMLPESSRTDGGQVYGMLSLFSGFRIARNTLVLIFCW